MTSYHAMHQRVADAFAASSFLFPPEELYAPINYALENGGKRLRPVLSLMTCEMFGGDPAKIIHPAMGLEIFHNFTLLHDDIMDNADLRRGRPTVHRRWDTNTAILSGDTMFVIAYEYVAKTDPALLPGVLALFNDTARKVCEGQQYDMNFETRREVSIADYIDMIRLKTAVLIACSMKLGAIIAGASPYDSEQVYKAGTELGLAFQLQDDYLDAFGDVSKFGKSIGGDISARKKTFLYLKAFEIARGDRLIQLTNLMTDSLMPEAERIEKTIEIYLDLKIDDLTRNEISRHHQNAVELLQNLTIGKTRTSEIVNLMNSLLHREN